MQLRTWLNVIAGTFFFRPPSFDVQKPTGQHRQCLMMLPADPTTYLIVRHPRFPFSAIKALFDTMFCFRNSRKFSGRGFKRCVAEIVVLLHNRLVSVTIANHHAGLFSSTSTTTSLTRFNVAFEYLDKEWPFLTITHFNLLPI